MKHLFAIALCLTNFFSNAQCILSGNIKGITQPQSISINLPFDCWYYASRTDTILTDDQGYFSRTIAVTHPQSFFLDYKGERVLLYAEPGKKLQIHIDSAAGLQTSIDFEGDLKTENTFRVQTGLAFFQLTPQTWSDTTAPLHWLPLIHPNQQQALQRLEQLQGKTSVAFQAMSRADIRYFPATLYWSAFIGRQADFSKHRPDWTQALHLIYDDLPVSDSTALNSYYYQYMLTYYPRYINLSLTTEARDQLIATILQVTPDKAMKTLRQKSEQYWNFELWKHFTNGVVREQRMAQFIDNGLQQGAFDHLTTAYREFTQQYPQSHYRPYIDSIIAPFLSRITGPRPPHLVIAPDSITTLASLLTNHANRVIYIDLWGSWCGPCKEEFRDVPALHQRYVGKPVDFIYIAFEHDYNPVTAWEKTIRYYDLPGTHLRAGKPLQENIRQLYNDGRYMVFPSYILVDRAGNIRTIHAPRPSDREALYEKIDQLLSKQ